MSAGSRAIGHLRRRDKCVLDTSGYLKFGKGKVPGSNSGVEKKFKLVTRKYEEYKGVRFGNCGLCPRG